MTYNPLQDRDRLPVTFGPNLMPLDASGKYVPHHRDPSGTVHWFSVVETAEASAHAHEAHYFRAQQLEDGTLLHDHYPVLPVPDPTRSPFPLPQLQMMLEDDDLENAQELAYHVAQTYRLSFPNPQRLPALQQAEYGFGFYAEEDGRYTVEATKRWPGGIEGVPLRTYDLREDAEETWRDLEVRQLVVGLEDAIHNAERIALQSGALQADRDDPRLFRQGPPDPFRTLAQEAIPVPTDCDKFRQVFDGTGYALLEPVDPTVNYGFEVVTVDPHTKALVAEKWWFDRDDELMLDSQVLMRVSTEYSEHETASEVERAYATRDRLVRLHQTQGLNAAMQQAERIAAAHDELDPQRPDGRLFYDGPPDRFTTLRAQDLAGLNVDVTEQDTQPLRPVEPPEPGSWEDLILLDAQLRREAEEARHFWRMDTRPAQTPEGEPLGTALFITEFPGLPPDFTGEIPHDAEAHTLEMAHFASEQAARKFEAEFRSYLLPGVIDGPELAPEVAKLEGLTGAWTAMEFVGQGLVIREPKDWHPYNVNAEREAKGLFENPQIDIEQ